MSNRNKFFAVWIAITALTLLLYAFDEMGVYPSRALPFIWIFFSWNLIAFGFDLSMWPRAFVQLDGSSKGHSLAREVVFWATAGIYLLLIATIAWAE